MKRIYSKLLNASCWITLLMACVLPFQTIDKTKVAIGYPLTFIEVFSDGIGYSPLLSMNVRVSAFIINIGIIYLCVYVVFKICSKLKDDNDYG